MSEIAWEAQGDEDDREARLYGSGLAIEGVPMHVEAYAVHQDESGVQASLERQRAQWGSRLSTRATDPG